MVTKIVEAVKNEKRPVEGAKNLIFPGPKDPMVTIIVEVNLIVTIIVEANPMVTIIVEDT